MKLSRTVSLVLALAAVLAVSLPIGAVKIQHLAHTTNVVELDLYADLAAKYFQAEHPDIEVEILAPTGQQWTEKLVTMVAAGIPPDTVFCANCGSPIWWKEGFSWTSLNMSLATRHGTTMSTSRSPSPRRSTKAAVMPSPTFSPMLMFINQDLFRQSGLADPPSDWTWDDFVEVARVLTRSTDNVRTQWGLPSSDPATSRETLSPSPSSAPSEAICFRKTA